ncbi:MAG TPA: TolC family protein [Gemmatimonadales bacterium]
MITVQRLTLLAMTILGATWLAAPVVAAQAGDAVPVVTLADARRRSAALDPAAVAARAGVSTAAWERRAALADLFTPTLTAATSYTGYNDPFFSFTGSPSTTTATATLQASYTLLGAGKLAEIRRSRASLASAEASEAAARFRTALATDAAYYAVLAEGELSRVAANRLRRATEQLGVARVRVLAGETISTDSLQLLLEVNRARLEVLRRDSALAVSRLRLGRRIGLSGPAEAAPLDTAAPPPLALTLEAASSELRARGPELEAARAAEREASAAVSARRGEYLPDVTLSAAAAAYDSDFFPSFLKRNSIALTISLPIWDGGRREVAFARALGQRDVARAQREDRERATAEEMAQAYNGYHTARAGIELALVGVSASAENYRVQGVRYREGATTILDLLEAQVGLGEAEATLVQARYAARLALAQIEALLGRRLFGDHH